MPKSGSSCKISAEDRPFFDFGALVLVPNSRCTAAGRVQLNARCLVCRVVSKMFCSLNVSLAVKYLFYARGGTVQTVYASARIVVLGSQFLIRYSKIFFFQQKPRHYSFQHAVFVKKKVFLDKILEKKEQKYFFTVKS